ncbi:MAG: TetR/AcrR family transcriptional regulator [Bacteroidales bacterium]|nr:TetR/AcrR family transcriptional regulator [Bacteroidales bacterium]MBQ6310035.1 TetR/AcrR family transcriptional regulator [Bacteroidales bacterium]
MIKREQILEAAFKAFTSTGIKDVKMEDIAASLKISKKTLYDFCKGKRDLVIQSLEYKLPQLLEKDAKIIKCMPNPLTALVFCAVENIRFWSVFTDKFMEEAKALPELGEYGKSVRKEMELHNNRLLDGCVAEGYLKEEDSSRLISVFMTNLMKADQLRGQEVFPSDLCFNMVLTIMGGLCTQKGRKVLDELKENYG